MQVKSIDPATFVEEVTSGDLVRRNKAYQQLCNNKMLLIKVSNWADFYKLQKVAPADILQEALILMDEKIRQHEFRGKSKVETFLLGICKNMIRDNVKAKKGRLVLKKEITDLDCPDEDAVADQMYFESIEAQTFKRDEMLGQTLEELTEKCRQALKLYYFEQKNLKQVAEERNLLNEEQAKKAVYRCRQQLRELIQANPALLQLINETL